MGRLGRMLTVICLLGVFAGASSQNRPVSKVITLLKDMQGQLEKEAEEDANTAETMACWCTTNDQEKTAAIANGEQRSVDLGAAIEEGTATSARLNTEIKATDGQLSANMKALDQATALRARQLADFNAEEKDMLQSISALRSAVTVLGKHHGASMMLQEGSGMEETAEMSSSLMNIAVTLKDQLHRHADLLVGVLTPRQRKVMNAFVEMNQTSNYAPQGGEVFGILNNMKENFEANLGSSQQEERDNIAAYNDLKAAKMREIAAGQDQLRTKTVELGTTDEKLANDKQDLEDTTNTLAADRKFLANVKSHCSSFDKEFEQRKKTRQEEIGAISKAMAVLTGDDAHDLFTKTFNPAFVQEAAVKIQQSERRSAAYEVLKAVAKKAEDPALASIAVQVKLAAFGRIKDTLEQMINKLQKEKEDEINHRDWCIEEMAENSKITELKDQDKEYTAAKIEDLASTMTTLDSEIDTLKAEIAEMQVQMKREGEDREMANADFRTTVSDQRATKALLTKALNILKGFYDKKTALVQKAFKQLKQSPPAGFKSYATNKNSGGVMGMMQQIIDDATAMETDAIHDEEMAQEAYEDFVKDTNDSIAKKTEDITNKSETRAQAEKEKTDQEVALEGILGELQMLANESADLHSSCDFILKNFEIKQAARDSEVEALKQSIGILSGAKGFLQRN